MRWFAVPGVLGVLVLLSGCLQEGPVADDAQPSPTGQEQERVARQGRDRDRDDESREDRSGNVTLRSYSDGYAFTLTSATALVTFGNIQGENCAAVEGAPFHILNGTATLTWTSQSALADELALQISTYYSNAVYEEHQGSSPLVVEFKDIEVEPDANFYDFLTFGVQLPGPAGASYEQDVTMALAFDYESDIDVSAYSTYC